MNWIILGISAVAMVGLSSCDSVGGDTVDEPTTEQMARLDQQWGLPARKVRPRAGSMPVNDYSPPAEPQPAPPPAAPAPELAPAPQTSLAPEPEPPQLDATALQKLR